jgi:hypothetical protein
MLSVRLHEARKGSSPVSPSALTEAASLQGPMVDPIRGAKQEAMVPPLLLPQRAISACLALCPSALPYPPHHILQMYPPLADAVVHLGAWQYDMWKLLTQLDEDPTTQSLEANTLQYGTIVRNAKSFGDVAQLVKGGAATLGAGVHDAGKVWRKSGFPAITRRMGLNAKLDAFMIDRGIDMPSATRLMLAARTTVEPGQLFRSHIDALARLLLGQAAFLPGSKILKRQEEAFCKIVLRHAYARQASAYRRVKKNWITLQSRVEAAFAGERTRWR